MQQPNFSAQLHEETKLVRLSELHKFEVADGDPDVRGWDVLDAENKLVGTVNDLIADPEKMVVRYLEVVLEPELTDTIEGRHILIPIGFATLAQFDDQVFLKNLPVEVLLNCPPFGAGPITRTYEQAVKKALVADLLPPPGPDFYAGHVFDASGIYGPRPTSHEPHASGSDEVL